MLGDWSDTIVDFTMNQFTCKRVGDQKAFSIHNYLIDRGLC